MTPLPTPPSSRHVSATTSPSQSSSDERVEGAEDNFFWVQLVMEVTTEAEGLRTENKYLRGEYEEMKTETENLTSDLRHQQNQTKTARDMVHTETQRADTAENQLQSLSVEKEHSEVTESVNDEAHMQAANASQLESMQDRASDIGEVATNQHEVGHQGEEVVEEQEGTVDGDVAQENKGHDEDVENKVDYDDVANSAGEDDNEEDFEDIADEEDEEDAAPSTRPVIMMGRHPVIQADTGTAPVSVIQAMDRSAEPEVQDPALVPAPLFSGRQSAAPAPARRPAGLAASRWATAPNEEETPSPTTPMSTGLSMGRFEVYRP